MQFFFLQFFCRVNNSDVSNLQVQFGDDSHNVGVSVTTNGRFSHDVSVTVKGPHYKYGAEGKFNLHPENIAATIVMDTGNKYGLDVKVTIHHRISNRF